MTFEIDPDGEDTQIQASVRFDVERQGAWVAYSVPDGEGTFDIAVARVGCDGVGQITPQRVNVGTGRNDIDPELARSGDDVLVVWSSDDGISPQGNIQILGQRLDLDGAPQLDEDAFVRTDYEGRRVAGSALNARLHPDAEGFVLVGVRGIDAANTFQAFVQRLDRDAGIVGDAVSPPLEVDVMHLVADVAVLDAGALAFAWDGVDGDDLSVVRHGLVLDGEVTPDPAALLSADPARGPALARDPTGEGAYVAASVEVGSSRNIVVTRADPEAASEPAVMAGGGLLHSVSIAGSPTGAGLAWYRNIGGLDNELWIGRLHDDSEGLTAGKAQQIPDAVAAPYASTITHVVDDVYMVVWSQGDSPAFRLYGRFVEL